MTSQQDIHRLRKVRDPTVYTQALRETLGVNDEPVASVTACVFDVYTHDEHRVQTIDCI